MGEPIRTRKGKLAGRGKHDARLGRVGRSKKGAEEICSFELIGKKNFLNYAETKSKGEKNKKNGSPKKTHRRQSVRYRSWWKQGNITMAMSEDHVSCWVHKDLTVTAKNNQALLTAARASGGKGKYQVRLTGIEREYWMGTEIRRLRLPRHCHSG